MVRVSGLQVYTAQSHWASCQPKPSSHFPQVCSQPVLHLVCTCAWDCPNTSAQPCTWPCWTSWGLHGPTSQASQGLLWMGSLPSGMLSANLLRMHSIPQFTSPPMMLNSANSYMTPEEPHSSLVSIQAIKPLTGTLERNHTATSLLTDWYMHQIPVFLI